jgi:metallo-beta-lactamase class B
MTLDRNSLMQTAVRSVIAVIITLLCLAGCVFAQETPDWTEPFPPYHVIGNLYYVGSRGLASYLITTPKGHILINSSLESSVPLIRDSISATLRFCSSAMRIGTIAQEARC